MRPLWRNCVILSVLFALGLLALSVTPYGQECTQQYYDNRTDKADYQSWPTVLVKLPSFLTCWAGAVDEYFEVITAIATIAVAGFTFALWYSTHQLWEAGERQLKLGRKQAIIAAQSARAARTAAEASKESTDLARKEFAVRHRPRLRVRNVHLYPIFLDGPIRAQFTIVNVGDSTACITGGEVVMQARPECIAPPKWPVDAWGLRDIGLDCRIATGNQHICAFTMRNVTYAKNWEFDIPGKCEITIRGKIEYADETGLTRHTGFIRICRLHSDDFRHYPEQEGNHEYED
jgi:hypothetical protein